MCELGISNYSVVLVFVYLIQAICAAYGSYLASVLHEDVLQEFYNYYGSVLDRHYWIGLNDKATDRTYVWDKGNDLL